MKIVITPNDEVLMDPTDEMMTTNVRNSFIIENVANVSIGPGAHAENGTIEKPAIAIGQNAKASGEGSISIDPNFPVFRAIIDHLIATGRVEANEQDSTVEVVKPPKKKVAKKKAAPKKKAAAKKRVAKKKAVK